MFFAALIRGVASLAGMVRLKLLHQLIWTSMRPACRAVSSAWRHAALARHVPGNAGSKCNSDGRLATLERGMSYEDTWAGYNTEIDKTA